MEIDRRSALMLGAAFTAAAGMVPARVQAKTRPDLRENPVLFWNDVANDLVALDHSIDPADARAPGPCATARALAVVHAVMADAVSLAYGANYRPRFYRGKGEFHFEAPELFVGGAAAGTLGHIFSTPAHAYTIGASRNSFQRIVGNNEGKDWQAGLAFATAPEFRALWRWDDIRNAILPQFGSYIPRPRRHSVDPYNAGQGQYGEGWGELRPLALDGTRQVAHLAVEPPPPEGSPEYERDLAEVRVKGSIISKGDGDFPARTARETNIGLFWAYDGARLIGTPPRLYNQILRKIAIDDEMDVTEMARMFALCNLAMADAGNVCWFAKYKYNVWRPVLGIANHARRPVFDWQPLGAPRTNPARFALGLDPEMYNTAQALMGGGGPVLAFQPRPGSYGEPPRKPQKPGTQFRDAAFTPNFPSYPSGHSTFGAAVFQMLKLIRAERHQTRANPDRIRGPFVSDELNGISIDHYHNEPRPYIPFDYDSLDRMIEENEMSRVFLGVHWRFDCNRGSHSGRQVAHAVYEAAYDIDELAFQDAH